LQDLLVAVDVAYGIREETQAQDESDRTNAQPPLDPSP
jgi:hypothetical protein